MNAFVTRFATWKRCSNTVENREVNQNPRKTARVCRQVEALPRGHERGGAGPRLRGGVGHVEGGRRPGL